MKTSPLAAGLKAAAEKKIASDPKSVAIPAGTVLIGAHFDPLVRQTLLRIRAKRPDSPTLKQLLGEAINDLCVKYGVPEPLPQK